MRKMIILFLTAMLCLATFTSACAANAYDAEGYYRADYTIAADKTAYAPSTIYGTRNGFSYNFRAVYDLQGCDCTCGELDTVNVHIYNRKTGEQVTKRLPATCGTPLDLNYLKYKVPSSSHQCKPVTYKPNEAHYNHAVALKARFLP